MRAPEIDFRSPKVQKILFAVMIFAGVNYVYFFTDYFSFNFPVRKAQIEERQEKVNRLAAKVEQAKRASQNLPKLEADLATMHADWELAMSHLPEKKEIASLLRRVTLAGEKSGVRFLLFEPDGVVHQGIYDEHPVNVKIQGAYHDIGAFLGRLMNLDRIVHVSEMNFHSTRGDEDEPLVTGEMVVSAYTVPLEPFDPVAENPPAAGKRTKNNHARSHSAPEPSNE
ncbi:MAG: type 4a pilus biogenesis protein PilO [Candidatus Eisenbacteria bacterium]|nr:type 4a pilus biogenesis protein PilO [Candidatus Eisenbacteria bacterium]